MGGSAVSWEAEDWDNGLVEADPKDWEQVEHFDSMQCQAGWTEGTDFKTCPNLIGWLLEEIQDTYDSGHEHVVWRLFTIGEDNVKRCEDCSCHYSDHGTDEVQE
jgi:hypothetical protein